MTMFLNELTRFIDKYCAQPDPIDEEASVAYWQEVNKAFVAWWKKYENSEHSAAYQK